MKSNSVKSRIVSAAIGFFFDKKGNLVLMQFPNAPLWSAIVFFAISFIPVVFIWTVQITSYLAIISFWGTSSSLLYWAFLEITSGDAPFRKALGLAIFIGQMVSIFNRIF